MSRKRDAGTLTEHLEEVRKRLIICVVCIIAATIVGFFFVNWLRWLLIRPAGELELIFITPSEALMADIRLSFMAGLILAMPMILTQLLLFVMPGLNKNEKKMIVPAILAMLFFFALGVSFSYFVVFPFSIRFFMGFASDSVMPMFTISNYLGFATNFIFAFGIVFQLPIVFYVLGSLGIVGAPFLRKFRKHALLVIVVISAFLTPPDVVSQMLLAGPLMGLYELGIILVVFSQRKKKKAAPIE